MAKGAAGEGGKARKERMRHCLAPLLDNAGALCVFLVSRSGLPMAGCGDTALTDEASLASLVAAAFAFADPDNNCVVNGSFVASQFTNGLIIGIIYGFMALGLTLIFSILGIVSFAHGEFYMVGGMVVYFVTAVWFPAASYS